MHRFAGALILLLWGCHPWERDNPLDPAAARDGEGAAQAQIVVVLPLPKALATSVDSLVARLEGPGMVPVVKLLEFDSPLGPAILTIGALSPGTGRTLTVEGYDLRGRLILRGQQGNIAIAAGDTTRVTLDLRLQVPLEELEAQGDSAGAAGQLD